MRRAKEQRMRESVAAAPRAVSVGLSGLGKTDKAVPSKEVIFQHCVKAVQKQVQQVNIHTALVRSSDHS